MISNLQHRHMSAERQLTWDFDCLLAVIEGALEDKRDYPDKAALGYKALMDLYLRLKDEKRKFK